MRETEERCPMAANVAEFDDGSTVPAPADSRSPAPVSGATAAEATVDRRTASASTQEKIKATDWFSIRLAV